MAINKTGAWVYLTEYVNVEIPLDKLSIYFGKPVGQYLRGFRLENRRLEIAHRAGQIPKHIDTPEEYMELIWNHLNGKEITPKFLREEIEFHISKYGYNLDSFDSAVEIVTPMGPVKIWPEEYNEVSLDFALKAVEGGSHMIRYLSNDGRVRDKMKDTSISDKVFYFRSRGISLSKALKMISGDIKTQYFMYFDPLPQYIEVFTRYFDTKVKRKIKYCEENGFEQLLNYKGVEDGKTVYFHLGEYLKHLEKQYYG